jgi:MFS family permease
MGCAQAVQALATIFLLDLLIAKAGFQWTFVIGALCWSVLFFVYVVSKQSLPIILIQAFHGLAYVFFMIGGQMFVSKMAPPEIGASAQSLIFIATNGIGLFLASQLAGFVMEKNSVDGKFQWAKIWTVPLVMTLGGAIVFAVLFKVPSADAFKKEAPKADAQQTQIAPAPTMQLCAHQL